MFNEGDIVMYGLKGVCEIINISTLDISGISKDKCYYTLRMKDSNGIIYVPVDSTPLKMRKIISKEDAEKLISRIPKIAPLKDVNEKMIESSYRKCLLSPNPDDWISLIKFIYGREQKRVNSGKKITAVDDKYMKQIENLLHQELSEVLGIPKNEIVDYISKKIKENE